jgi:hypothetical protein
MQELYKWRGRGITRRPYGRTEADDVVIPRTAVHDVARPGVVLDPPDEPLWATLDLTDILEARDRATRELMSRLCVRVHHDLDPAQPPHELVLDATHESLRAGAGAPERLAHAALGEAELPRVACFGVRCRGNCGRERSTAREVWWERYGERCVRDWYGWFQVAL